MITIAIGVIVACICLYELMTSNNSPFSGTIMGPGFIVGVVMILAGLADMFLF